MGEVKIKYQETFWSGPAHSTKGNSFASILCISLIDNIFSTLKKIRTFLLCFSRPGNGEPYMHLQSDLLTIWPICNLSQLQSDLIFSCDSSSIQDNVRWSVGLSVHNEFSKVKYAGCNMQDAMCRMKYAGCNMQDAICRMQYAGCNMQDAICRMQYAGFNMQDSICRMQYAVCNLKVT